MKLGSKRGFLRKLLTGGLIATLPVMLLPVAAQPLAGVKGTVFTSEAGTPLIGARVHLMQVGTKTIFSSTVSDAGGAFDLDGLPAASYEAAVEFEGGLYIVDTPVVIAEGEVISLNLAIPHVLDVAAQRTPESVAGAGAFLSSPLAATLLVAGSAISMGALIESATDGGVAASAFQ